MAFCCVQFSESLAVAQQPLHRAAGSGQLQIDSGLWATPQAPAQGHPRPITALPPEGAQEWMQSACSLCVHAGEV